MEPKPKKAEDVVLIHDRTEDGQGVQIIRKKGDEVSAGELRPLEHGKPISGEVLKLKPREEQPWLCDVEVQVPAPKKKPSAGPAKVATPSYRDGWDSIWGSRRRPSVN